MIMLPRLRCYSLIQHGRLVINQWKQIHAQMIVNRLNHPQAMGKLIECYCAASITEGSNYARLVYKHSDNANVFIYNVMIQCMAPKEGIRLFADGIVLGELVFDKFTYIYVLGACARSSSLGALWEGKQIHSQVLKVGFMSDVVVQTTGIHFYGSCEDCCSARNLFDEMPVRNSASWNAMISSYCSQGKRVNDNAHKALMLFHEMLRESDMVKPTDRTVVCVLSACSRLGDLVIGSCVHGRIEKTICTPEDDLFLGTSLVDMYAKCGCLGSATSVFNRMSAKNVLTWTSMMTGLAMHGQGNEALEMLNVMQASNIRPNAVTFTSLLFACCHAGLVEQGIVLFDTMSTKFGIRPKLQHYGCMVDLLGRAGRLQEAYEFILEMPIKPDAILWRSLLGACKIHGEVVMGEKVGRLLFELQAQQEQGSVESRCEDFVALCNVYALGERWENVELVREMMRLRKIEIEPGSSSVQL